LVFTSPVTADNGKIIGAISAALDLKNIENQIQSLDNNNSAEIMLVDSRGLIVSDSLHKFVGQRLSIPGSQSGHQMSLSLDNKYVLQSFTYSPTPEWQVIVQYPYKDVYKNSFLYSFLLLNITVCLAFGTLLIPGIFIKKSTHVTSS
jgi:hypothetical protein